MRQSSIYTSAALHVLLLLLAIFGWPFLKRDFIIPPPISVELAEVGPVTETIKVAPKAIPKPEEPPKEEPPPPTPENKATEVKPPVPEEKKEEKAEEKPKEEEEAILEKKKKEEKKKQEKKEEKKTEEKPKDFASVLKNLAEPKPVAPAPADTPDMKADAATPDQAANAPLGEKMTMSEEDALRRQLEGCWNVPFGAKDAENTIVEIFMVINPDRTLREARIVDTGRYNSDTFYRAMADSALRAVRNPLCSPFQLPADKYDTWKTTTVTFNPSQMF